MCEFDLSLFFFFLSLLTNITEKVTLCSIFLPVQGRKHSFGHFSPSLSVLFDYFVLMPQEQVECLVVFFNSLCGAWAITWTCCEFGYVFAQTGDTVLTRGCLVLFFWRSHGFCLFLPRLIWNKLEVTSCRGRMRWSTMCNTKRKISVVWYLCDLCCRMKLSDYAT